MCWFWPVSQNHTALCNYLSYVLHAFFLVFVLLLLFCASNACYFLCSVHLPHYNKVYLLTILCISLLQCYFNSPFFIQFWSILVFIPFLFCQINISMLFVFDSKLTEITQNYTLAQKTGPLLYIQITSTNTDQHPQFWYR